MMDLAIDPFRMFGGIPFTPGDVYSFVVIILLANKSYFWSYN